MRVEVLKLQDELQEPALRLSAKATRQDGVALTEAEIEEAELEAEAWARRVNSCCGAEGL